ASVDQLGGAEKQAGRLRRLIPRLHLSTASREHLTKTTRPRFGSSRVPAGRFQCCERIVSHLGKNINRQIISAPAQLTDFQSRLFKRPRGLSQRLACDVELLNSTFDFRDSPSALLFGEVWCVTIGAGSGPFGELGRVIIRKPGALSLGCAQRCFRRLYTRAENVRRSL